ncbi:MAG: cellulose biosynthesis cyclic di-GMP-binding regulatory protein BcsB [Proteobacteria bacterium]|nr:cellulose biosynthesis cyclic di-GMP-binding regulatory protein BcsB [Pseudomonadota bacterium]
MRQPFSVLHALRKPVVGVLVASLSGMGVVPVWAQRATATSAERVERKDAGTEAGAATTQSQQRVVSMSLKQLGAWSSIRLRGVEGHRSLFLTVRADEVVVSARLRLAYDYSPALIPELSHLAIALNDRVVTVEGLPAGKNLGNVRDIALNPRWFKELNELRLSFIGHYTRQCEDPYHSSLWLSVSDLSRLELTLAPVSSIGDLRHLPAPFIDRQEAEALMLPFAFSSAPSLGTLEAAGTVASWFGAEAGTRGATFPARLGELPEGNGVVFLKGGESIGPIRSSAASNISIQQHPNNPLAKLLVVSGANEAELQRAAHALVLTHRTLGGTSANITKETQAAPRKPYDAPAWVRLDRPMKFGELVKPEELRVQGYFPEVARMNYRVPPDLFTWRTEGVPVNLKYRATRLPTQKNSSLSLAVNNNFLGAVPLNELEPHPTNPKMLLSTGRDALVRDLALHLPPHVATGRDQLQMTYAFDIVREGICGDLPPDNLMGAVDPESTIDFSGFPHYAAMPNLAYFAKLGFPFTRMADLSETAVVLPARADAQETSLYLAVMGRMGESTGYPALRHRVISSSELEQFADRDLIVIGSGDSQSLMKQWADRLPVTHENGERRVRESLRSWRPTYRWEQKDIDDVADPGSVLNLSDSAQLSLVMGIESPLKAKRSVVFLYADRAADLRKLGNALTDFERVSSFRGDMAVVDDKLIRQAKVGPTYYIGELPLERRARWFFQDQPWLLAVAALLAVLLLSVPIYRILRRVTTRRKGG